MSLHAPHITADRRGAEQEWVRVVRDERRRWRRRVGRGRAWFDKEVRRSHRRFKQSIPAFLGEGSVGNLLTTPIIYSVAVPFLLLDLFVTAYQWMCFPIYGMARVRRGSYFAIDHHKLAYLNTIEKANCVYCSYANGLIAYVREVTARTEHYWCPIKHSRPVLAPHGHYQLFLDYDDAEGYRRDLPRLRKTLRRQPSAKVARMRPRAHGPGPHTPEG